MSTHPRPSERAALHPRLKALLVLIPIVALAALLQRTPLAPLPHRVDDFLGGLAVGLVLSGLIGWWAWRD